MSESVILRRISRGAEFEINLAAFPEAEPLFAYVDDVGCGVEPLEGLVVDGVIAIAGQPPYMWLKGLRNCVLLKAPADRREGTRAAFRSLGVGEFCLEIYHVLPNEGGAELLHRDDFIFK